MCLGGPFAVHPDEVAGLRDTGLMSFVQPHPRPSGAIGREAVEICRQWMTYLGATDVVVAEGPAAEVCDLYSSRCIAWVASQRGNLSADLVERAANVSALDGRQALVFVAGGVFPSVQDRADALSIGLIRFDARRGHLDGANRLGRRLVSGGILGAERSTDGWPKG